MPNAEDRRDILRAVSRKIGLSTEVDLNDYVKKTKGYSGADLQALLYNAHLACVHSNISEARDSSTGNADLPDEVEAVDFIALGGSHSKANAVNGVILKSKAEKAQMTKRVSTTHSICGSLAPH
jgi:peroxin-1